MLASFAASPSTALGLGVRIGAVLLVTTLTAAAAQISVPVPLTPVPLTFQPMVVLLAGAALGPRLGLISQALYLAAGIAGLPVFAASAALPPGIMRLLGPTGGYLLSYPIAAWVTGSLAARGFDRRYVTAVIAMGAGLTVIFAGGVTWLAWFALPTSGVELVRPGFRAALASGFYPFIVFDLAKVLVAAAALPAFWKLTGHLTPDR